jgi:ABC-type phosphate/phosphonate transport system substrate-binding protein
MRRAALPMYDPPSVRASTDALWRALAEALRARGVDAPATLTRGATLWEAPDLLLSQTCGYPFVTRLRGRVRLVATPVYAAPGCEGARYRSALVIRADDRADALAAFRGRRAAFNAPGSQSGYHALRAMVAPLAQDGRFFAGLVETGSHIASAHAVAGGSADLCALDCVSWALLAADDPALAARLRVLDWSATAPGLPLITAADTPDATLDQIRGAVLETLSAGKTEGPRAKLFLKGAEILPGSAYDEIRAQAARADALGYKALG